VSRRALAVTLALGLAASLLALALVVSAVFAPVEGVVVDTFMRLRGPRSADARVVVCLIDEGSVDRYGRWPWPRTLLAELVDRLAEAGARVIAFDVVFSEASRHDETVDLRSEDEALALAIERSGNVVLSFFWREGRRSVPAPGGSPPPEGPRFRADPANVLPTAFDVVAGDPESFPVPEYPAVEPNLDLFAAAAASQGYTTNRRESGVSRRQGLAARYAGEVYPALPLRAVQRLTGGTLELARNPRGLPVVRLAGREVEVDETGRLWVSYPGGAGSFRRYPAHEVLEAGLPPGELDGAIVFVGASEVGIGDVTATPFGVEIPGVLVQAAVADNLLDGRFLRESGAPRLVSFLALLLVGPLVAFLVAAIERHLVGSLVAITLVVGWPAAAFVAFLQLGWHLEVVGPMAAGVLALVASLRYQVGTVEARARQIRRTFARFVSEAIVEEMLRHPERVKLGGERRELTVLFSDIRGFTSISERMSSEELVQVLNQYFTPMTRLVLAEGGTLDKYMGDALMAFFGAPVALPDHAARACRAALAMRSKLAELNAGWRAEGKLPEGAALGIGVGLNSGEMSVGNMGSEDVFDYTVIGDNVNLGSRIEGLNKLYGTDVLASEATALAAQAAPGGPTGGGARAAGAGFLFRELDRVRVKGKKEPVAIYELMAERPAPPELEDRAARFAEALAHYRSRRFEEAAAAFQALADDGDPPAAALARRAARLATEGAPEGWEPVETLTSK
jgi:adenylate cyclase